MTLIKPLIRSAPGQAPSREIDLTDKANVRMRPSVVNDVRQENWLGFRRTLSRTIQKLMQFKVRGLTVADKGTLDQWKGERAIVRPYPGYGPRTLLYHSFQRSETKTLNVGTQIGEEPTFGEASLAGGGKATYTDADGLFVSVAANTPRYQAGPYGADGLMIEPRRRSWTDYSYPDATNNVWQVKTGTPSIGVVQSVKSKVKGETDVVQVSGVATEAVRVSYDTGPPGATEIALSIWLSGRGDVIINVNNLTVPGLIATTGTRTLNEAWTLYTLTGMAKAALDTVEIEVQCSTSAIIQMGPLQLESQRTLPASADWDSAKIVTSWIDTRGFSESEMEQTQVYWPNLDAPAIEGSIHVAVIVNIRQVAGTKKQYILHKLSGAGPNRFGLWYDPVTSEFVFQLKATNAKYVINPLILIGTPVLISVTWKSGEIKIYHDGVLKTTQAFAGQELLPTGGMYLGDFEDTKHCYPGPIQFIRVDQVANTDAEVKDIADSLIDPGWRALRLEAEGRDFEVESVALTILQGVSAEYDGTVLLRETQSTEQSTTEKQ